MLIISKFHDYYDTALAHGVDKTCVYQRKKSEVNVTLGDARHLRLYSHSSSHKQKNYVIDWRVVGFCGEIYPHVQVTQLLDTIEKNPTQFFYTAEPLMAYLDEIIPEERKHVNSRRASSWRRRISDVDFKTFFDLNSWGFLLPMFVRYRVPCFLHIDKAGFSGWFSGRSSKKSKCRLILNPRLKDYAFMKVKAAYTACQEIHMYLSGVIGAADRDMAEVGNDDRIKQRGFDKWSFRREPTKRKRR